MNIFFAIRVKLNGRDSQDALVRGRSRMPKVGDTLHLNVDKVSPLPGAARTFRPQESITRVRIFEQNSSVMVDGKQVPLFSVELV